MKSLAHHYRKHHERLKKLDHKILELIHGAELSLVLIVSILGISLWFVLYVTDLNQHADYAQIEQIMESQEWNRLKEFTKTEQWSKLLMKLMDSKEGRAYLGKLIKDDEDGWMRWAKIKDDAKQGYETTKMDEWDEQK